MAIAALCSINELTKIYLETALVMFLMKNVLVFGAKSIKLRSF